MKTLLALTIIISIFFLGKLSAQPRSLDELVEFRADGIYAKKTWVMKMKYWPAYKVTKGDKICEIIEE